MESVNGVQIIAEVVYAHFALMPWGTDKSNSPYKSKITSCCSYFIGDPTVFSRKKWKQKPEFKFLMR